VTTLVPTTWWRGLGSLTRSGSAAEGLGWALYDFANTIFSFAIVSFAMSLWAIRFLGEANGQFWFTVAVSASVLVNAIVSPVLGAMSDRAGRRKGFLLVFTLLAIVPTTLIGLVDIGLGLLFFALANFAYQAALIYYDALLPDVARPETRGRLSGIGVALGYLGTIVSGLLLRLTFEDGETTALSFLLVGSLFALFAAPLFVVVQERRTPGVPFQLLDALRSWSQLRSTLTHARESPGLLRFLVGRFFYTDPVNTAIAIMSAFATQAIGFTSSEALSVLLLLTVVAVLASFGWGLMVDRWGPKRILLLVLGVWALGLLLLGLSLERIPFYVGGALLGAGLGGVAVTDRLLLLRLAPSDRVGEMFGLYGLVGKFSAVIGPVLYGVIVLVLLQPLGKLAYQAAILSLLGLLLVGFLIVRRVPEGLNR
jgi:MFS transporter, UMF1 family